MNVHRHPGLPHQALEELGYILTYLPDLITQVQNLTQLARISTSVYNGEQFEHEETRAILKLQTHRIVDDLETALNDLLAAQKRLAQLKTHLTEPNSI